MNNISKKIHNTEIPICVHVLTRNIKKKMIDDRGI